MCHYMFSKTLAIASIPRKKVIVNAHAQPSPIPLRVSPYINKQPTKPIKISTKANNVFM